MTSVDAVGTPPHQLPAKFQSVLVVPNHVPAVQEPVPTFNIPVAVEPKYCKFLKVAEEAVLPHEPAGCPSPPSVSVAAEEVNVPRLATAVLLIVILFVIVVALLNVFVPDPASKRLP